MFLIQLLLPRCTNDGERVAETEVIRTRDELVSKFSGVTAYLRSPAQGQWVAPAGAIESDDVVMVEVLAEDFDRPWWRDYAATLAQRFGQHAIHVRALSAHVP